MITPSVIQSIGFFTNSVTLHILGGWLAVLCSFLTVIWAIFYNEKRATRWFALLALITTLWALTTTLQIMLPTTAQELLIYLRFILRLSVPFVWFMFAVTYTGKRHSFTEPVWFVFSLSFISLELATFINPIVEVTFSITTTTTPFLIGNHTLLGLGVFQTVIYYIWLAIALAVIIYDLLMTEFLENWRTRLLIVLIGLIIASDLISYLPEMAIVVPGVDYAALVTGILMPVFILALYRHDVFDITPIARGLVVDVMDDVVIVLNESHEIIDYNEAATMFFQSDIEEAMAMPFSHAMRNDLAQFDPVQDLQDKQTTVTATIDDQTKHYDLRVSSITTATMEEGAVLIFRDITELQRKTRELERQNERLDDFTTVVAHDLRSPLAVAQAYADDLQTDINDDRVETISDAVAQMDDLISDVSTLTEQGATVNTDTVEECDLATLTEDAWEYNETDKGALIVEGTMMLECDRTRVKNLLSNLLQNTLQHGTDSPTVFVGPLDTDHGFYVEDNGPGVDDEMKDRVFEHGVTTTDDGTGYGLTIVRAIAEAHDWEIELIDGREGGARFEFYL